MISKSNPLVCLANSWLSNNFMPWGNEEEEDQEEETNKNNKKKDQWITELKASEFYTQGVLIIWMVVVDNIVYRLREFIGFWTKFIYLGTKSWSLSKNLVAGKNNNEEEAQQIS